MKKVLITGVSGFVGSYLIDELKNNGDYELYGTKLENDPEIDGIVNIDLDLTDKKRVHEILNIIKPDIIFHLAAQSSVKLSWDNPELTVKVNVLGTINLLEEIKIINKDCRILLVGSSEEYGKTFRNNGYPKENDNCYPQNIYAVTKMTQNHLGEVYANAYNMNIVMTRSFNHFGPKQRPQFVIADFCDQVARIEAGLQEPTIRVGNLSAGRDFTDVRDIVHAYYLLAMNGISGETYNVGSGIATKIQEMLNKIIAYSDVKINVEIDENKFRPIEIEESKANIEKLIEDTKWSPKHSMDESLYETLEYYRSLYKEEKKRIRSKQ